ncbi:integumentary mucin C.1-like [Armigeres subalbatus]|uniref:integumentary mucin C.1-like n=1 Tax=Armigeres subalbatus TaxID=124917 RepID=UPI002ED54394
MFVYLSVFGTIVFAIVESSSNFIARPCLKGFQDFMCPTPPTALEVYFPHEVYCNRYYKCLYGVAHSMNCPPGTYFNQYDNVCSRDKACCRRVKPCNVRVPNCLSCSNYFVTLSQNSVEFGVCNYDGTATKYKCPEAFDPFTKQYVPMEFYNGRCEANGCLQPVTCGPKPVTTTAKPTTTTTSSTTTTTTQSTTTTQKPTTTTTETTTTTTPITTTSTTTEQPTTTTTESTAVTTTDEPVTTTTEDTSTVTSTSTTTTETTPITVDLMPSTTTETSTTTTTDATTTTKKKEQEFPTSYTLEYFIKNSSV